MEMKSFTRVTLALDILRKISEGTCAGYHELAIIKHQIDLFDTVSVKESNAMSLSCNIKEVPCSPDNICWKAALALKEMCGIDKNVHIDIDKNIPVMGGLAGGSANAATMIMLLNDFWQLNLTTDQVITVGRKLGMDVPFYFVGGTAFDSEATSQLYTIPTSCTFTFVLAVPDFGVSTKAAYSGIDYDKIGKNNDAVKRMIDALGVGDTSAVYPLMHNDFELTVFREYPALKAIKAELLDAGCCQAMLTGSGSTIIGIVPDSASAESIAKKISCRTIIARTLGKR